MTGRKGKIWESQSREIVLAVDKYFEQEKSRSSNLMKVMTQLAKDSNDSETITLSRDLFDEVVNMLKNTNRVTERVVAATGISKNTVSRIRGEGAFAAATSSKICSPKRGKRGPNPEIDKFDINAIKNLIEHMYEVQKCNPTVGKIFIKAKEDLNFPGGETTLRKLMKEKLGYKFKKCPQKKMELVEKEPNVSDWGVIYLPIPMED